MTEERIGRAGEDRFQVKGDMIFSTVRELLAESKPLFQNIRDLELDLSGVNRTDSAGLALLLEWIREAEMKGGELAIKGVPESLLAIARLSHVDEMLRPHVATDGKSREKKT